MKIIYSQSPQTLHRGEHFQNPRHFTAPIKGASAVVIDGDWPNIAAAYEAAGVPVSKLGGEPAPAPEPEQPSPKLSAKIRRAFPASAREDEDETPAATGDE